MGKIKISVVLITMVVVISIWIGYDGNNFVGRDVVKVTRLSEGQPGQLHNDQQERLSAGANDESSNGSLDNSLLDDPKVKSYQRLQEFQRQTLETLKRFDELSADEQHMNLESMEDGVDYYESAGKLVPAEALLLRLAMLKYSVGDEQLLKKQSEELVDLYRKNSERRNEQWRANPDPKFVDFKQREQIVLKEVLAMESYPDGLTQGQYLRQRLKEERLSIYNKQVEE